jgi:hypothetical protein
MPPRLAILHPHMAAMAGSTDDLLAVDPRVGAYGCSSLRRRRKPVRGVVVHTTGRGLLRRVVGGVDGPGAAAARRYARGAVGDFFGHYLIDHDGRVYALAHPERVALHTAALHRFYGSEGVPSDRWRMYCCPLSERMQRHGRDEARVWDWWNARWPELASPVVMLGRNVNAAAVGIDLLPLDDLTYTAAQVESCAVLVEALSEALRFSIEPMRVVRHEDVDPLRRGAVRKGDRILGVPWDPGPSWNHAAMLQRARDLRADRHDGGCA